MNIRELRIGNLVKYKDTSPQIKVIEIEWYFFAEDHYIKNSTPIPISEEWLIKLGFVYIFEFDEYQYLGSTWFKIQHDNLIDGKRDYWFDRENLSSIRIKYVHQLQNLYFALTGEELIKEYHSVK